MSKTTKLLVATLTLLVLATSVWAQPQYDLESEWTANTIHRYFWNECENVTFTTKIHNRGLLPMPDSTYIYTIWVITRPCQVWTLAKCTHLDTPLKRCESITVTSDPFHVPQCGTYTVYGVVVCSRDRSFGNNISGLEQYIRPAFEPATLSFDDGELEEIVSFVQGCGPGMLITPGCYPDIITNLDYYFGTPGTYHAMILDDNGPDGEPGTVLFDVTGYAEEGWNTIAVDPPIEIPDGSFYVAYIGEGMNPAALGADTTPPVAGMNPEMSPSWFTTDGGATWTQEFSNDWAMRVGIITGGESPHEQHGLFVPKQTELFTTALKIGGEIRYQIPKPAQVELSVYSADGRKVITLVNEYKPAGTYTVHWDGTDTRGKRVPAGTYICRLEADGIQATEKMIRLK